MSAGIYVLSARMQATGSECIVVASPETQYAGEWLKLLAAFKDFTYRMQIAHWNVKSNKFREMHDLFNEWYGNSFNYEDIVAEQIKQLDTNFRIPTSPEALQSLSVIVADRPDESESKPRVFLIELLRCLKSLKTQLGVINALAEGNKDLAGVDLLGEISRIINKGIWFTKSYLKK